MSPRQTFYLDLEGYNQCGSLLDAAGIQLVDQSRQSFDLSAPVGAMTRTTGQIISPRGMFQGELIECAGQYKFVVMMHGDDTSVVGIIDDMERAFSGHLVERH